MDTATTAVAAPALAPGLLDTPLQDLIQKQYAQKKRAHQQKRRGAGPRRPSTAGGASSRNTATAAPVVDVGSKILVSNLDFGVTESDLRELFETVGPLKKASLSFDANGRSKGQAEIIFIRKNDAVVAMKRFNDVSLDGRPMRLEFTTRSVPIMEAPVAGGRIQRRAAAMPPQQQQRRHPRPYQPGGRGGRGGRRGGGQGRKQPKSANQLDAEMDSYMSLGNPVSGGAVEVAGAMQVE